MKKKFWPKMTYMIPALSSSFKECIFTFIECTLDNFTDRLVPVREVASSSYPLVFRGTIGIHSRQSWYSQESLQSKHLKTPTPGLLNAHRLLSRLKYLLSRLS